MATRRRTRLTGKSRTIIPDYLVSEWKGLNTFTKDIRELEDGETPDALNWLTSRDGDHISLRRGYTLLGQTRQSGTGRISGLAVATRKDGTQIPFFTTARSIKYYDASSDDTKEINTTNILPSAASGEDVSVMPYKSIAGDFCYLTSQHSSIYKIPVANPGDAIDLKSSQFRGYAKVDTNRMFLWKRIDAYGQEYTSIIYVSVSEGAYTLANYTQTNGQSIGVGNGVTTVFSGTLPGKASTATVFQTEVAGPIATAVSVSGITKANLAVVTANGHGLSIGDAFYITGVSGMTQINNLIGIVVSVTDANTFTASINSSAFTAYSSGGSLYKCEYWNDDGNGNLVSSAGGTGTINYATGAYSLTFVTPPISGPTIYAQYYSETSTTGGIADFTGNGSATYNEFDGGGDINVLVAFDQVQYALHQLTSWALNVNSSTPTNLPFRNKLGTPFYLSAFSADDGVVYVDISIPSMPQFKMLVISPISSISNLTAVPKPISKTLDLSTFGFTKAAVIRWSDYDLIACAPSQNGIVGSNNTAIFARNIYSKEWDYLDIPAANFAEYLGTLIAGDSLSNNVFTLFSGTSDDQADINNYRKGKLFNLGVEGRKKFNRFVIKGLIQQTQSIDISLAFDGGSLIPYATVSGKGSYVNLGNPVTVGEATIGSQVVGGGGDVLTAYPFEVEFTIPSDIFQEVQPMFRATGNGYVQIDSFAFKDIRYKGRRVLPSRTASPD